MLRVNVPAGNESAVLSGTSTQILGGNSAVTLVSAQRQP